MEAGYIKFVKKKYLKGGHNKRFKVGHAYIETPEYSANYIKDKAYLMNLEVNFINNYNMRKGNYVNACMDFERIVNGYPKHAICHYCLAICYKKMGKKTDYLNHIQCFKDIVNSDEKWQRYADYFNLIKKEETFES